MMVQIVGFNGFESKEGEHNTVLVFGSAGGVHAPVEVRQIWNCYIPKGMKGFFEWDPSNPDPNLQLHQYEAHFVEHEQNPRRVRTGARSWMQFWMWRCGRGGLVFHIPTQPGQKVTVRVSAHIWANAGADSEHPDQPDWSEYAGAREIRLNFNDRPPLNGDPWNDAAGVIRARMLLDPAGGEDLWSKTMVMDQGGGQVIFNNFQEPPIENTCIATGSEVTVWLLARAIWPLKHLDVYWDDLSWTVEDGEPEPPTPQPTGRGAPRTQYGRRYNVIPGYATDEQAVEVFRAGWLRSRETAGGSYDDAGIGDLDDRTAVLYGLEGADQQTMRDWYARWYPGVKVELAALPGETPPPPPPEPEPEPVVTFNPRSISMHAQSWNCSPQVMAYRPAGYKRITGCQDLVTAMKLNPGMMSVYRAEQPWQGSASNWIDQSLETLHQVANQMEREIGILNLPQPYFYLEAVNEVYCSSDPAGNLAWRNAEIGMAQYLYQKEPRVGLLAFCAPVGNPPENEYGILVDLAAAPQVALGYHAYWPGNVTQPLYGLAPEHLPWLAGRWMAMDDVIVAGLKARGITRYPRWFFGEAGVVGGTYYPASAAGELDAVRAVAACEPWEERIGWSDAPWHQSKIAFVEQSAGTIHGLAAAAAGGSYALYPLDGWKSPTCLNGDKARYVSEQEQFADIVYQWNLTHGGRAVCAAVFTTNEAYMQWNLYRWLGGEWANTGAMMLRKWPLG